ncbi:MAG: IS200/IS605 family transposase [Polyangia bacterium]
MKQSHSYHRLLFHLVFSTKNREHLIDSHEDGHVLAGLFAVKAHHLEVYIEEFGYWRDHVHLLVRIAPKLSLAKIYGQLKGFASHTWNDRFPERKLYWQDGVFSVTVDPDDCNDLRWYIRNQWNHHESGSLQENWEMPDIGPKGLPAERQRSKDR